MTTKRDAWDTLDDVLAADNLDTEGVDASEIISAIDILRRQQANEDAARTALPHKFDKCTYSLGYINQNVYACLTCHPAAIDFAHTAEATTEEERDAVKTDEGTSKFDALTEGAFGSAGMCYACSIACHGEHDIVELFVKRRFRCDCGTNVFGKSLAAVDNDGTGCCLKTAGKLKDADIDNKVADDEDVDVDADADVKPEEDIATVVNGENRYNHNFQGRYCWCNSVYDVDTESDVMHQCLVCQDWFHTCCIGATPSTHPSMLIEGTSFDDAAFICRVCVDKHPLFRRLPREVMVVGHVDISTGKVTRFEQYQAVASNGKRTHDEASGGESNENSNNNSSADSASSKRIRTDSGIAESTDASSFQPCILSATPAADSNPIMLFLAEGWQHALCDCDTCLNSISSSDLSFLIQPPASASGPKGTKSRPIRPVLCRSPEPIYEPEAEDNDDPLFTMSLHDAGLRLFNQRRDTMSLEQQAAYMRLQNEIIEFLRPFAAEGRVVTRNDILQFFEQKKRDVLKEAGDALGYYDPSAPKPPPSSS